MDIATWQIIFIVLLAALTVIDSLTLQITVYAPVGAGFLTGLILGDVTLGLAVGGTLQLMILGVGTYGGASIPDYASGAIIGTIAGVTSNQGVDFAIGIGVPVGLLLVQLDVLARFSNVYFLHRAEKQVEDFSFKKAEFSVLMGAIPWILSRIIPVLIVLLFGQGVIDTILNYSPDWLMDGLEVSGGILPIVGIAILLRYLPTKKFVPYFIIGFVFAAFLDITVIGVALIGLAIALIMFKQRTENHLASTGGGFDEDE